MSTRRYQKQEQLIQELAEELMNRSDVSGEDLDYHSYSEFDDSDGDPDYVCSSSSEGSVRVAVKKIKNGPPDIMGEPSTSRTNYNNNVTSSDVNRVGESSGLRLTSMNAPTVADLRDDMELDCHFDMGTEDLYAVKWYKDDHEFFRYMPHQQPNTMLFPVAGVHLAPSGTDCRQNRCKITLENLSRAHSGGAYRCEISSEAPAFRLASETHNVIVAALPKSDPKIEGLASSYLEGDMVSIKCVSDFADPEPILSWKINGQDPSADDIGGSSSTQPDSNGLVSRSIALRFPVERKASRGSSIEIRCESALPGVPVPKQTASLSVLVRNPNDPQVINNQKLHWSANGAATQPHRSFHIAWTLIWVAVVKWSIARILK